MHHQLLCPLSNSAYNNFRTTESVRAGTTNKPFNFRRFENLIRRCGLWQVRCGKESQSIQR